MSVTFCRYLLQKKKTLDVLFNTYSGSCYFVLFCVYVAWWFGLRDDQLTFLKYTQTKKETSDFHGTVFFDPGKMSQQK